MDEERSDVYQAGYDAGRVEMTQLYHNDHAEIRAAIQEAIERLDEAIWSERSETVRWLWVSVARNRLAKILAGEQEA